MVVRMLIGEACRGLEAIVSNRNGGGCQGKNLVTKIH
jgi:hypothetical protein